MEKVKICISIDLEQWIEVKKQCIDKRITLSKYIGKLISNNNEKQLKKEDLLNNF